MTTDALLSLILTAAELIVGIVVLLRNPHNNAHRLFFTFVALLSLWGVADVGLRFTQNHQTAFLLYQFGIVGFCLNPVFYLHFMSQFTNSPSPRWRPAFFVALYGIGLALSLFLLRSSGAGGPVANIPSLFQASSFAVYAIWPAVCIIGAAALVVRRLQATTLPQQARTAMRVLLGGILGLAVIRIVADAVVPIVGFRPILSGRVGGLMIVGCSAFALVRYRGMVPTPGLIAEVVIDAMADLVCLVDLEGVVTYATGNLRKTLGLGEAGSMQLFHVRDFVKEADVLMELIRKGRTMEQPMFVEVHFVAGSGARIPVSLSIARLDIEDAPPSLVLIGKDLTERKELVRKAAESEEKYHHIVESSLDGIVIIQDGNIVFANSSAVKTFGYARPEEMMKASFGDTVAPGSKPFLIRNYDSNRIGDDIFQNYEMKGLTKSGSIIDLEINAKLVSWNEKPAIQASFRDITERKNLEREQALWFWEQESLSAIDKQLVAMVDLESVLNTVTHHARAFCRADFSGIMMVDSSQGLFRWKGVRGNLHPVEDSPLYWGEYHRKLLDRTEPLIVRNLEADPDFPPGTFSLLSREGVVTISAFPIHLQGTVEGVLIVGFRREHPIGERETRLLSSLAEKAVIAVSNAGLYENLRRHERELEHLSQATVLAQEDERRRIARGIHDGLGQMLTAIKFSMEVMEDSPELGAGEKKKLVEIRHLLDNVMTEAREISYNLMPSVLEDFGLVPALQLLCETFSKRLKTKAVFVSHGANGRFDPSLEINLYRIAQEALNNVSKYADARSVEVQLLRHEDGLRMTIVDDGKGFFRETDRTEKNALGGMGLLSMRERATSFGGLLTIESSPGRGTSIIVEIPNSRIERHESH